MSIRVGTKASADAMAAKLTAAAINAELAKEGLSAATIVEEAVSSQKPKAAEDSAKDSIPVAFIAIALLCGIAGGIIALVIALAIWCGCRKRGAQVHADEKAQESQVRTEDLEQALPQLASGDMPPAQSGTFDCVNTSPVGTPVPTA